MNLWIVANQFYYFEFALRLHKIWILVGHKFRLGENFLGRQHGTLGRKYWDRKELGPKRFGTESSGTVGSVSLISADQYGWILVDSRKPLTASMKCQRFERKFGFRNLNLDISPALRIISPGLIFRTYWTFGLGCTFCRTRVSRTYRYKLFPDFWPSGTDLSPFPAPPLVASFTKIGILSSFKLPSPSSARFLNPAWRSSMGLTYSEGYITFWKSVQNFWFQKSWIVISWISAVISWFHFVISLVIS